MLFITVQPFLDPFNTYASVEPLDSSFMFRSQLHLYTYNKRMKLSYKFHPFELLFWIFFMCCDNTIFFTTIHWIINATKSIYTFLQNPICFFPSLLIICQHFISLDTLSSIGGWHFLLVFPSVSFPSLTFSSPVDNVKNVLDCRGAMTTILENKIFTASSEVITYRRRCDFQHENQLKTLTHGSQGLQYQISKSRKRNYVSKRQETLYSKL